jgi:hypothetical protein
MAQDATFVDVKELSAKKKSYYQFYTYSFSLEKF